MDGDAATCNSELFWKSLMKYTIMFQYYASNIQIYQMYLGSKSVWHEKKEEEAAVLEDVINIRNKFNCILVVGCCQ